MMFVSSVNNQFNQQHILDSNGLLPKRNWKTAWLHVVFLVHVVILAAISGAQADMVFDFQMKLAKKGNPEAQFKVGEMYEAGRGVEKDMDEAMKWINKANAQGNKSAGYKLLYLDLKKNGVTTENKPKIDEMVKAAQGGDGYAQYILGSMYANGYGVKQDYDKSLNWLGKATLVGVTAAEAEMVLVNESKQNAQASVKKEAEKRAREKEAERKKLEAQKEQQRRNQQEADARNKAEQEKKLAEQQAAEAEARKQRLMAQKKAEDDEKRKAVMAKRKEKEKEKKQQFESDPCAGKSARFLSTCR